MSVWRGAGKQCSTFACKSWCLPDLTSYIMLCSPLHAYRVQTKVFKEACSDLTDSLTKKVNTAAFEEAKKRPKRGRRKKS